MLHWPILAALTDTHLYFADKFRNLDIDTFGVASSCIPISDEDNLFQHLISKEPKTDS